MWPSAVVLFRWLASNPTVVCDRRVLELGAGCGLVGLAAARLQQLNSRQQNGWNETGGVVLTDFNLRVLENLKRNVELNELGEYCEVAGLDFYQQQSGSEDIKLTSGGWKGIDGSTHAQVDVVLAADMICQSDDAYASANAIYSCLKPGDLSRAYVVCADASHRFGVDHFPDACRKAGLEIVSEERIDRFHDDDGKLLASSGDLQQTSGYVPGMKLILFQVKKR